MFGLDSLKNLISGLGTSKDKAVSTVYDFTPLTDQELISMHRSDWLARKIVDIIPNDMTREWRDWQADDKQIEDIEALEKSPRINLQLKINLALKKARLLRGSIIYMGLKDHAPNEPLDLDRIGKGDLEYLLVLGRPHVNAGPTQFDIQDEFFGEPSYYEVATANGTTLRIHPSRVVRFIGAELLDDRLSIADGWGDSVLQIVYDAVLNASSAQAHVSALIPEAKTDVIYIPQLAEYLKSTATTKQLTDRFTYANTMKSVFNMLLLQGTGGNGDQAQGERWEQKQISFAQLPELIAQYLQIASGAADIPVTRLIGQSPKGLNATGDSDIRNYYDNVAARQRTELQPALFRLDEVIIRAALGTRDPSIYYTWAPLWGLSETEKATNFKMIADGARAIAGAGAGQEPMMPIDALSDALVNRLVEDGTLPGLEAAIEEYGRLSDQEEPDPVEAAAALTPPANQNVPTDRRQLTVAKDAAPRTLYVSRKVTNADAIIRWAKSQGFETTLPAADMHVTIAFSRTPIDWFAVGESWSPELKVGAGGPRQMQQFGDATVLLFTVSDLRWRHDEIERAGASWDWPEYQPHITISYGFKGDLSKVEPYQGEIVLGPELFAEVKEDWAEGLKET